MAHTKNGLIRAGPRRPPRSEAYPAYYYDHGPAVGLGLKAARPGPGRLGLRASRPAPVSRVTQTVTTPVTGGHSHKYTLQCKSAVLCDQETGRRGRHQQL